MVEPQYDTLMTAAHYLIIEQLYGLKHLKYECNKKKNVVELSKVSIKSMCLSLDYNAFVDFKQTYKKILLSAAMLVVVICQ